MLVCRHNLVIMCKVRGVVMHYVALVSHQGFGATQLRFFTFFYFKFCFFVFYVFQRLICQFVPTKRKKGKNHGSWEMLKGGTIERRINNMDYYSSVRLTPTYIRELDWSLVFQLYILSFHG